MTRRNDEAESPWVRIVDHLADSVLEETLEELASDLEPGQTVSEAASSFRNKLLAAFDGANAKLPTCRMLHGPARRLCFIDVAGDKPMTVIVDRYPDGIIFVLDVRESTTAELVKAAPLRHVQRLFQRPIEDHPIYAQ